MKKARHGPGRLGGRKPGDSGADAHGLVVQAGMPHMARCVVAATAPSPRLGLAGRRDATLQRQAWCAGRSLGAHPPVAVVRAIHHAVVLDAAGPVATADVAIGMVVRAVFDATGAIPTTDMAVGMVVRAIVSAAASAAALRTAGRR